MAKKPVKSKGNALVIAVSPPMIGMPSKGKKKGGKKGCK